MFKCDKCYVNIRARGREKVLAFKVGTESFARVSHGKAY